MKTKFIFALAALLLMGSASLKAQENNNSSTTYEEGDLNHDGEVDVADITYLVNLIMNKEKRIIRNNHLRLFQSIQILLYILIHMLEVLHMTLIRFYIAKMVDKLGVPL